MYDKFKAKRPKRESKFWAYVLCGVGAILLFVLGYVTTQAQFEVYKKKHGDKMTFYDFLMDSERK